MTVPVVIVDYDPRWPAMYQEEKDRVLGAIGHLVVAIEHIGSTAVPGLGAKPIIDIMTAVPSLADAPACVEPLERIGYEYIPEYEADFPERRYFRKRPVRVDTHHLHMVEQDSGFWERHILFRDDLRVHPETAHEYERLKRELAAQFGSDRDGYTDAKTSFIESVVAQARAGKTIGSHRA
jgi:GrpB-like predicted nucleotidyltransferase (UPF0157 family)